MSLRNMYPLISYFVSVLLLLSSVSAAGLSQTDLKHHTPSDARYVSLEGSYNSKVEKKSLVVSSYHSDVGVLQYVNPRIGTYGSSPDSNGGMIPSVSPPFGMTRWTPQTRENYISQCPYHDADLYIHGFQATHQPAIWMGESGQVVLSPGWGEVNPLFDQRGLKFSKNNEKSTAYVYEVILDADSVAEQGRNLTEEAAGGGPVPGGAGEVPDIVKEGANGRVRRAMVDTSGTDGLQGLMEYQSTEDDATVDYGTPSRPRTIQVAQTATSHVGCLRFDFNSSLSSTDEARTSIDQPYVFIQATRQNWTGHVEISPSTREISGSNSQRQDYALGPSRAPSFRGYFVSRFSKPFTTYGITYGGIFQPNLSSGSGTNLGAYVKFASSTDRVEVRTGVSFVSVEQARRNLDIEIPDGTSFETTVEELKDAWLEKLGRVTIGGVNQTSEAYDPRTIWYTGLFHALQYPSDFSEPITSKVGGLRTFYSGYTDSVHEKNDSYYQSWSIWDTYRAEHSLLTLFAPERVNGLLRSLLQIFDWSGRLPMWANVVETNIMIGTHVDAVIANALTRGFRGFDIDKAWEAVKKNAFQPPEQDENLLYFDREPYTPDEVRAGLTMYMSKGYVPNDMWAESASRTLDYAFDDYAASIVASHANNNNNSSQSTWASQLLARSTNYRTLYNPNTTFMEALNANGTRAGSLQGWTEGDDWVYTFDVMHDIPGLATLLGGRAHLKAKLDAHFDGGHNDHTNEPSHHVPYLYAAIGYPASTQNLTRTIAFENYNATAAGLSGNEDLGQMSAWYVFSAMGFYPVNPATDEYVVGAPFFEEMRIRWPAGVLADDGGRTGGDARSDNDNSTADHETVISAPGAPTKPYVKSLRVDGVAVTNPVLHHGEIIRAGTIMFEMADGPQEWGSEGI